MGTITSFRFICFHSPVLRHNGYRGGVGKGYGGVLAFSVNLNLSCGREEAPWGVSNGWLSSPRKRELARASGRVIKR